VREIESVPPQNSVSEDRSERVCFLYTLVVPIILYSGRFNWARPRGFSSLEVFHVERFVCLCVAFSFILSIVHSPLSLL